MLLNVIQLAEFLGVEVSVVEAWVRHEGLPHDTDQDGLLFDRDKVADWAALRNLAAQAAVPAPEPAPKPGGRNFETMLRVGGIWRDVPVTGALPLLSEVVAKMPGATPPVRQILQQQLHAPDGISWALVGGGLALPHLRTPVALGPEAGIFAIVLLREAIPLNEPAPDEQAVTKLLFFVAPAPRAHLEILAQLSKLLARGNLRKLINDGASDDELMAAFATVEAGGKK